MKFFRSLGIGLYSVTRLMPNQLRPVVNPGIQRSYELILEHPHIIFRHFTIFALSSGQGKCGVSVIRISGEEAKESIFRMTKPHMLPKSRVAVLRYICNPNSGEHLDKGLVLWFPGPKSFTGEDMVEFHIHGGKAVASAVLSGLGKLQNYMPAQPGDFTKRAFYNSKLDLTSVEGLGDLIHSETEAQRKQALRQMEGSLMNYYSKWRQLILRCRANIEAFIDFSEDENIEPDILLDVEYCLKTLIMEMKSHLKDSRRGERLKSGLDLIILGRPNVGKSTFLNFIVQRPAAIVSSIAGTTRDLVEVSLDVGGYPVNVIDTAGLRATDDILEKEGVKRALNKISGADVAVIVMEATMVLQEIRKWGNQFSWEKFMHNYLVNVGIFKDKSSISNDHWFVNNQYLILVNKIDLIDSKSDRMIFETLGCGKKLHVMSLKTNVGVNDILLEMRDVCSSLCSSEVAAESPYLTSVRHRVHIETCLKHIERVVSNTEDGDFGLLHKENTVLFAAQHLQLAADQIALVTGRITTDDILDQIFSSFCIGK